ACGTPGRCAHGRSRRSQRATLLERSTVPPAAHTAPAMTTTSSAQRMAPTGCRAVRVAASSAEGGLMLGPTVGVARLTAGVTDPLADAVPDVVGVVEPEVVPDDVLVGDGDGDGLASARS